MSEQIYITTTDGWRRPVNEPTLALLQRIADDVEHRDQVAAAALDSDMDDAAFYDLMLRTYPETEDNEYPGWMRTEIDLGIVSGHLGWLVQQQRPLSDAGVGASPSPVPDGALGQAMLRAIDRDDLA